MEGKKNGKKVTVNISDLEKLLAVVGTVTFDNVNNLFKLDDHCSDALISDGVYKDYGAYADKCHKAMLELIFKNGLDKDLIK